MNFPEITTALKDYPRSQSLFPPKPRPKRDSGALGHPIKLALMSRGKKNRHIYPDGKVVFLSRKITFFLGVLWDFFGLWRMVKSWEEIPTNKFVQMKLQEFSTSVCRVVKNVFGALLEVASRLWNAMYVLISLQIAPFVTISRNTKRVFLWVFMLLMQNSWKNQKTLSFGDSELFRSAQGVIN